MGCQNRGNVNRRRSVSTADDSNGTGFLSRKNTERHRADEGDEDAELCRSTQQEALRVGNQRTKVRHRADAEENQRRVDAELNALIEVIEQSAVGRDLVVLQAFQDYGGIVACRSVVGGHVIGYKLHLGRGRRGNAREHVDQQHAERNRQKKQRLKFLLDRQIQENKGNENHDIVTGIVAQKTGSCPDSLQRIHKALQNLHGKYHPF